MRKFTKKCLFRKYQRIPGGVGKRELVFIIGIVISEMQFCRESVALFQTVI